MLYYIITGMSFSIWIAAVAGLVRFRKADPVYYPFIILCWTAAFNEMMSLLISIEGYPTHANNNIYLLVESMLFLWQFKNWVREDRLKRYYFILAAVFALTWFYEYNSLRSFLEIRYYFRFLYGLTIIFLSINLMQRLVIEHASGLGKDPRFLIAAGAAIYFTVKILFDAIWLYKPNASAEFQQAIFLILACINFLTNLLYALAVLWIPKKPHYIKL